MEYEVVEQERLDTAVVRATVRVEEMPQFFGRAFGAVFAELGRLGIDPSGEPFAYYPTEPAELTDVEAGVPVGAPIEPHGEVVPSQLPGGRAAVTVHVGPYTTLGETYGVLTSELDQAGLAIRPIGMWEFYETDPDSEPDEGRWRTRVVVPLAV